MGWNGEVVDGWSNFSFSIIPDLFNYIIFGRMMIITKSLDFPTFSQNGLGPKLLLTMVLPPNHLLKQHFRSYGKYIVFIYI